MKKITALLVGTTSVVLLATSLQAAVSFTAGAGTETVPSGGGLSVPVTVSGFTDLSGFQFSLSWNAAVLAFDPETYNTVNPLLSNASSFGGNPAAGTMTFLWDIATEMTLPDNTTIFSMLFSANGDIGTSTALSFVDNPTLRLVTFADGSEGTPGNGLMITVNGGVTVVPEPVDYALGLFAGIFVGTAGVRRFARRRVLHRARA